MSHRCEEAADEPNTKVDIGDKAAEEIMDDGSIDDTTVDDSNDDVIEDG